MTAAQLTLPIKAPKPAVSDREVSGVLRILRGRGAWMKREEICRLVNYYYLTKITERKLRKIAEHASPAIVSWPGSPGYRSLESSTIEEVSHAANAHEAQAAKEIRRATAYRNAAHSMISRRASA